MPLNDIALFDLDNTLCDYTGAMKRDYNLIKSPTDPEYRDFAKDLEDYEYERIKLIRNQPGWWRNLKRYQPGFDILNLAIEIGYETDILTKAPSNSPNAWTEKFEWSKENIQDVKVTITPNKKDMYGKMLVDDNIDFVQGWLKYQSRGLVIMPAHPYNEGFSHPNMIRYDQTNLDKVRKAMEIAKARKAKEPLDLSNL